MTDRTSLSLPPLFEPYRTQFEASMRPYIRVTTSEAQVTSLTVSKFGGYPYLPLTETYPFDTDGSPMALLAQINFSEMPSLPPYPEQGILQIFLGGRDHYMYGWNSDRPTEQHHWRTRFYPSVELGASQFENDFTFLPSDESLYKGTPYSINTRLLGETYGLSLPISFERASQPISPHDHEQRFFFSTSDNPFRLIYASKDKAELDAYHRIFDQQSKHQIGGYAFFAQDDPRWRMEKEDLPNNPDPYLLLLQIDSPYNPSGKMEILWGDAGIGNFFIRQSDLIALDFSHVLYNWDCY